MAKTVCFFGIYDPAYSRNRVLMRGFRENGWNVVECRVDPRRLPGAAKYFKLVRRWWRVRRERPELVIVAFPGHTVVPLARLLWGKEIIFDAFLSLYDSNVLDRKVHEPGSFAARLDQLYDRWSCRLARIVLLDTAAHIEYFVETFRLPREKFVRVFVGSTLELPSPAPPIDETLIHFHGTYIPLHGIETILHAAKELAGTTLRIRLLGRGQEHARIQALARELALTNVEFVEPVAPGRLAQEIAPAALCLGIFGTTEKARRVIPNKVYEYLAMGKAIITADTPAIRELEILGTPLPFLLVPAGDPVALAAAIRTLVADPARLRALASAARTFSGAHLSPARLVKDLLKGVGEARTDAVR